ncbi:hypothetical protein ACFOTA_11240 [Chitinophaga sp. GCM10012297]|uniref:Uncharacterized protein n=1 Tax=Chitinophaga chungangae TaxID=2821488 RepID=A0ABS3YFA3_9BACT|nr:hypothetical protein [Chitinophaga chungangae]MBO9152784.1 hypothetical protein [Chitinophaga chungangae]
MKHGIVNTPKTVLTALALVLGISLQATAQSDALAYVNTREEKASRTASTAPEEANFMAQRGCKLEVTQEGTEDLRFLVQIVNPHQDKLVLLIKDANNNTLHKEVLDGRARFLGRFNMDRLEDGAYTFEIRNGRNKLERSVDIKTQLQVNRVVSVE